MKMPEKTRSVDKIYIEDSLFDEVIKKEKNKEIENNLNDLCNKIDKEIKKYEGTYRWLKIGNKTLYYVPDEKMLVVDPTREYLESQKFIEIDGYTSGGMKFTSAQNLFSKYSSLNPLLDEYGMLNYVDPTGSSFTSQYLYLNESTSPIYRWKNGERYGWSITDKDSVKLPVYYLDEKSLEDRGFFFIRNNLNLFEDTNCKLLFDLCVEALEKEYLFYDKETGFRVNIEYFDKLLALFTAKKGIDSNKFDDNAIRKQIKEKCIGLETYKFVCSKFLSCDATRIHMEKYSGNKLKDPESGHWDLWPIEGSNNEVKLPEKVVARNPVYDALNNKSGVVGIDFGTKSTVVTFRRSRADILPMRIGSGQYARAISMEDYENPTVMEFRDIDKFLSHYTSKDGRPSTCWNDILISHEAYEQLKSEQSKGDTFATFFSELKQWASDKERQVKLRDWKGVEIDMPPYLSLKEDDFDPIEIYAYYIGLFINNMHDANRIFLRYKLSFPAKAEKKVRDRILNSFRKGLMKSLPQAVLDNEECMKIFRVEQGASEPAAYAICALQEYGFDDLKDDEKIYYGIFDFGGGTTDFDFGVWSNETDDKYKENYDFKISRFGKGEDPYLGGENLLENLAYSVFLSNYETILKDEIVFTKPYGAKDEVGRDWLIKQDSQFAHFNTKRLMEKLRGVWEGDGKVRENVKSGSIQIALFDMKGVPHQNYKLDVCLDRLDKIIEERIENGIVQFFSALKNSFTPETSLSQISKISKMHIFLAGNSSRSPIVSELFKKYIDKLYESMSKDNKDLSEWIKVYPPLGSVQAEKIQNRELEPCIESIIKDLNEDSSCESMNKKDEKDEDNNEDDKKTSTYNGINKEMEQSGSEIIEKIRKPNGKTGVAFGLLDNKVRIVHNEVDECGFTYYIGQNRRKKFRCIIDKDKHSYNVWIRFCSASVSEFDIWFTRSSEAPSNSLPIDSIGIYSEVGFVDEPHEDKSVYIRLVSPTAIEYVIALEDEIKENNFSEENIVFVSLQEKL